LKRSTHTEKKDWRTDLAVLVVIIIAVFAAKYPAIGLPYYWDALSDIAQPAASLAENNFLSSDHPLSHPPLGYMLLAIAFKIFGPSHQIANASMVLASCIALYFIYLIGAELHSRRLGIIAASLSFLTPIFFSQAAIAIGLNLARPLFFVSLFYCLRHDVRRFAIFSTLLVLIRETEVISVAMMTVYLLLKSKASGKRWLLAAPYAALAVWVISNKLLYSYYFFPLYVGFLERTSSLFFELLRERFIEFFVSQYRILLTIAFLLAGFSLTYSKHPQRDEARDLLFISIIFANILFYSLTTHFVPRYFASFYPLLILLSIGALMSASKRLWPSVVFTIVVALLFISGWHGDRNIVQGWRLEDNMEYADSIRVHELSARYLEANHGQEKIITCWPMTFEITDTGAGYVDRALDVAEYRSGIVPQGEIIYFSPQSNCHNMIQEAWMQDYAAVKEFRIGNKLARIYMKK
jgi:4-amino-4-deoxy-L-arabinose transferase-like glycosyltransferase